MLERYAEHARRTVFFARYEAVRRGSSEIRPEHILLGLFGDGATWPIGLTISVSAQQIRDETFTYLPEPGKNLPRAPVTFDERSQEVLAAAEEEAEILALRWVSNDQILLGLLRVEDCFASELLRRNGVSANYLREQLAASHYAAVNEPTPEKPKVVASPSPPEPNLDELEARMHELVRLNDYQGALRLVDDAIADPNLERNRIMWSLVPTASVIARTTGDLDLARRYCEQRVACHPDDAMALYELADCLALEGKADEAKELAHKSYKLALGQGVTRGQGLAELIEKRFPEINS